MKRIALVLALLVLGAGVWLLARGDARPGAPAGVDPAARQARGPRSGAELVETTTPTRKPASGVADRTALAEAKLLPTDGVTIQVVTAVGGRAVPGAYVLYVDEESLVAQELMERSIDEMLSRFGQRYRTDGDGLVMVPRPRGKGFVTGSRDGLWGMLSFAGHELDGLRLELVRDPVLEVRVVDEHGSLQAGVPVALRQEIGSFDSDVLRARTDANGVARLHHVLPILDEITSVEGPRSAMVSLAVLLENPVDEEIDLGAFPERPLELTLPPTGSVEVRLEHADQTPVGDLALVQLIRAGAGPLRRGASEDSVDRMARTGSALFEHVGLGLDLWVRVSSSGTGGVVTRGEQGPRAPGERVYIAIVLEDLVPVLVGRAVDEDGGALGEVRLRSALGRAGDSDTDARMTVRTDSAGRFRLSADEWSPDERRIERHLELWARRADGSEIAGRIVVPPLVPGRNAIGDVVLAPPPLIAAGRVFGAEGIPVSGANVLLEFPRAQSARTPAWRTVWDHRATSDAQGRFAIHGFLEAERIRLSANHDRYTPSDKEEVAYGAQDVVLALHAAGSITGRLSAPAGVHPSLVQVKAISESLGTQFHAPYVASDGSFEISSLLPDVYTVRAELRAEPDCFAAVAGISVASGRASADTRLDPLDLSKVHAWTLTVLDAAGERAVQGLVRRKPAGSVEYGPQESWLEKGVVDVVTCERALDLEIDVPGHRLQRVSGADSDRTVFLEAGPRVRLELATELPEMPPGAHLIVQVRGENRERWTQKTEHVLDADGTVEFDVQDPGAHAIFFRVLRRELGPIVVSQSDDHRIDVEPGVDETQVFELELTADELERLRAELR